MIKYFAAIIIIYLNCSIVLGQSDTTQNINDIIETLLEESTIDVEDSQLYDLFEELLQNPININSASIEDLLAIPLMNFETANLIVNDRNKFGQYFSENELNQIDSIDQNIINKIKPFITVRTKDIFTEDKPAAGNLLNTALVRFRSRFTSDIQDRRGFKENRYQGDKIKSYNRLKIISPDFAQINILTDKDPGENSYSDFLSANISFQNIGPVSSFTVGDYLVEFGQGLALWSPYSLSKGSEAVRTISRNSRSVKPYTSSFEANFMRGAAGAVEFNKFLITGFYSNRKIDATIVDPNNEISTILLTGYHRTETELAKKNNVNEKIFGGHIHYSPINKIRIGLLHYNINYDMDLISSSPYDLGGKKFSFTSFSYTAIFGNITISGEASYNGISIASINNFLIKFSNKLQFVTSVRNYPRNYFNLLSNGFGESSGTQNEFGIYTGLRWRTNFGLINVYFDQFKFPVSTFSTPLPSSGNEFLIDYFTRPFSKTELRFRYKRELKEISDDTAGESTIVNQLKQQLRIELTANPTKFIRTKTRAEFTLYQIDQVNRNENGFLIFQDIRYRPVKLYQIYARFTIFDTKNYDTRIYAFENDLTGILTNNALFGQGTRWYILLKLSPLDALDISIKYAETFKPKEGVLSSGLNEIEGSLDNRISMQLDLSF